MRIQVLLRTLLALALLAGAATASAHEVRRGELTLRDLHLRASLGAVPNSAGYVTVANAGRAGDRLVAASCACAARVELHDVSARNGVMRMRAVPGLPVPPRGSLQLRPGGAHLMLLGLRTPLRAGQRVPMILTFVRAGRVTAEFEVVTNPSAAHAEGHAGHH